MGGFFGFFERAGRNISRIAIDRAADTHLAHGGPVNVYACVYQVFASISMVYPSMSKHVESICT